MKKKKFKKLVEKEALNLYKHTTNEEKELLSIAVSSYSLDPISARKCIYGSMTGYCFNPRAKELMNRCTKKFVCSMYIDIDDNIDISQHKEKEGCNWSPIEVYVNQEDANIKAVVKMITKGKSKLHKL
jgi:hypothetical protein